MLVCSKCGKKFADNTKYCPGCGAEAWLYSDKASNDKSYSNITDKTKAPEFDNIVNDFNNTVDTTFEFSENDIRSNKGMAVLSYIGLLVLIPICLGNNSKFVKYHANQGLVLFICSMILNFIGSIFSIIPVIGETLTVVLSLGVMILQIIGIVNVINGRAKELPIVGKYRVLK